MKARIITRCTRMGHLLRVRDSVFQTRVPHPFSLRWVVVIDTSQVFQVDSDLLRELSVTAEVKFMKGTPGDMGHQLLNACIEEAAPDEWLYFLDDDNLMHPNLLSETSRIIDRLPEIGCVVVSQDVGGKDFTRLQVREADPSNMRVQGIDMAQFILRKDFLGAHRFHPMTYVADGILISELFTEKPEGFHFEKAVLSSYNALSSPSKHFLPRVLVMGGTPALTSWKAGDFESDELSVRYTEDDRAREEISSFDPDCILTVGESYAQFPSMMSMPMEIRKKWIHPSPLDPGWTGTSLGEQAYQCAMISMLRNENPDLVSVFTPLYRTGNRLWRTYESLRNQTHTEWEWVIVNDSDDRPTHDAATAIASQDPRVKLYDFRNKSRGIIGESKYRACMLSNGEYLMELDHDDYLLPDAISLMLRAFREFPDAGFAYSDCAEIDEHYNSLTYGEGFAFGYGKYRVENHLGRDFQVADTADINPITIRHIVGVPNHFRAWRRETYMELGGHNRRLTIADDYELVVRTFLKTRMVKVPQCCYLQFFHGGNSQDASRSDIQRRVRTIASFYNEQIRERFVELGKEDWAYTPYGGTWGVSSRFGEEENSVNYRIDC